jgi:hypothetical protein
MLRAAAPWLEALGALDGIVIGVLVIIAALTYVSATALSNSNSDRCRSVPDLQMGRRMVRLS